MYTFDAKKAASLQENHNYEEYFALCREGADADDPDALYRLACCYADGTGTEADEDYAIVLGMQAAFSGSENARSRFDSLPDSVKIRACLACSDRLSPKSVLFLAKQYKKGVYVARDTEKAYNLFVQVYSQFPNAMYEAGVLREAGRGCERDMQSALDAYLDADGHSYKRAQSALSRLNRETEELRALIDEANKLNPDAQYTLGEYYEHGLHGLELLPEYAFRLYSAAESGGSCDAAFRLGLMYERVQKRPVKAFEMYEKAAKSGKKRHLLYLAYCYDAGIGTQKNIQEAQRIYRRLADEGSAAAAYMVCRNYINGTYLDTSSYEIYKKYTSKEFTYLDSEADEYITDAQSGDSHAQFCLALLYELKKTDDGDRDAAEYYSYAAKSGFAPAAYRLGLMYLDGRGVPEDEDEALRLFEAAVNAGYAPACYRAGRMLTGRNDEEAAYCFSEGVKKNHAPCMLRLSLMHETGRGIAENKSLAYNLVEQARKYRFSITDDDVAHILSQGFSSDEDLYLAALYTDVKYPGRKDALSYYKKCAENGYSSALFRLGLIYEDGRCGQDKSMEEAFSYYDQAAQAGHSEAMYKLALCYRDGIAAEEDKQTAFDLLTHASMLGSPNAKMALAEFYEKGICTLTQKSAAVELYREAAKLGNDEAREILESYMRSYKNFSLTVYAAKNGNAAAQYELAIAYITGMGIAENEAEGYKWMERAAKGGNADANLYLARSYDEGVHYKCDLHKAKEHYRRAAEAGNTEAAKRYADLRVYGQIFACYKTITQDRADTKTRSFLQKLSSDIRRYANDGNAIAMYLYALFLETADDSQKKYDEATGWYYKAAQKHNRFAMYETAERELAGNANLGIDLFQYYSMAAEEVTEAVYRVGYCYEYGIFCSRDTQSAVQWYERAAEAGNRRAVFRLGKCCEFGRGTERDTDKARELYEKVKDYLPLAKYRLSLLYVREGRVSEGIGLMRDAAGKGCVYAIIQCGLWDAHGYKCNKSEKSAFNQFMRAASEYNPMAQYLVAECMRRGIGTQTSEERSYTFYERAALQGHPAAAYHASEYLPETNETLPRKGSFLVNAAQGGFIPAVVKYMQGKRESKLYKMLLGISKTDAQNLAAHDGDYGTDDLYMLSLCCEYGLGAKRNLPLALRLCATAAESGCSMAALRMYKHIMTGTLPYDGDEANAWFTIYRYAENATVKSDAFIDVT